MRKAWFGWIVFCAFVATQGCRAPSLDWNGKWRLNSDKSSFQGQVLTISISGDSEYSFDENTSHTISCDGKNRAIENNLTLTCVKSSVKVLDITLKENGVKTRVTHDEISADGKVLTTTVTEFRANAPVITSQIVFWRLAGSNDFVGQWRDTSYLQQHAEMILRLDNQVLHIDYPGAGEHIDATLDGVEAAVLGPHAPEATTCAVRPAGRREFIIVTNRHGKLFSQSSLKLSNDGRIITESWWNPYRPAGKGSLVYEKE
jgi:hypothetical protein